MNPHISVLSITVWGGYAGYFQDPDGHLWGVVFNPDSIPQGWENT